MQAKLGDCVVNYRFDGRDDAPVLVLSNSLGTTLEMWEPQIPALSEHFRVLRYDTRGHGQTSVPPGPYTIAQMGMDVLALLSHVGVAKAHFCGLSMGGMIGMWLGINAPGHVERLVLCNTAARIGPPENWNTRIARVREGGMAAIADIVVARWFTPAFLAANPAVAGKARQMLIANAPEGYVASCAAVRDMDQRDDVGRISANTLVIAGTHDAVTTPADCRYLVDRIDVSRYVELDAAHISNLEQPVEYTRVLLDFLTE